MRDWTTDQILALAPDASSAAAGQSLVGPRKWSGLGKSDRAVWGLCQGSGKEPYQTRVDLAEPAFKCTCPSRKFPCKHGLGLMLTLAKDSTSFTPLAEPPWVAEWLDSRVERAEKKSAPLPKAVDKPVDAAAQAKRAAQRHARVADGVAACRLWLDDLVRKGLAAARSADGGELERVAARMVDFQVPGLATQVRRTSELLASGSGWETRALDHLGRLHLLLQAAQRINQWPPALASEIRAALGYNQPKEEVLAGPAFADRWLSVGAIVEEDDRLRVRRTWLVARRTGKWALLLDFAAGLAPLPIGITPGTEFDGEVAYYPALLPLRGLVKSSQQPGAAVLPAAQSASASVEAALATYASALSANPWLVRWPLLLQDVVLARSGSDWCLADRSGDTLPLSPAFQSGLSLWRLLAASGGIPVCLMAEWDGHTALPLTLHHAHASHPLLPGGPQ
jgi:hypothetical protein